MYYSDDYHVGIICVHDIFCGCFVSYIMDTSFIFGFKGPISSAYIFFVGHSWCESRYVLPLLTGLETETINFKFIITGLVVLELVYIFISFNSQEIVWPSIPKYVKVADFCSNFSVWFWLFCFDLNFAMDFIICHIYYPMIE